MEKRLLCADMIEIRWRDALGLPGCAGALLEDISRDGACLHLEEHIRPGLPVSVHYGDVELHGVVKYCVFREIGYFAGVHFDEASRWTASRFEPKHLLDPCKLRCS